MTQEPLTIEVDCHLKDEVVGKGLFWLKYDCRLSKELIPLELEWTPIIGQLRHVSVGPAGVWGVQTNGNVFYRNFTRGNDGSQGVGEWVLVMQPGKQPLVQPLRNIDVGTFTVWGVNSDGTVFIRVGIDAYNPIGCDWVEVPRKMKQVSISPKGHVWATDGINCVYRRVGVTIDNNMGTAWEKINGSLQQITVGSAGVWGVNGLGEVFYREGTYNDPDNAGTSWTLLPEKRFVEVSSGEGKLWGTDENEDVFYRAGLSFTTPTGLKWVKLDGRMRQIDVWFGSAWGTGNITVPNIFGRLTSEQLDTNVNRI
ncbi:tectonin beta-propeller repeat-containing protein 1-like [Liolophura sinensis]|uniref:tectonin beta-propeller repeat-containing protein 1-like n=1 Tax=Liolophura sinensis TaxID=3198878 RepID=UPI00315833D5